MQVSQIKRLWPFAAAILVLAGIAVWWMTKGELGPRYITAPVDRGSVVRSVTATGTVNPVIVVQVGTYDSGPIIAIYADFNSPVKAGQLIAKIDPRPFTVKVHEAAAALGNAQAQLGKDQADLAYKKLTFERDAKLHAENVISQDTLDNARSAFQQDVSQVALDRAMVKQQQANLEEAQVNLDYTNIISPVDGTVVSRNVDVGQTVAASFQTPTLFLIAKDLTQMQVDTNVSESDIGDVREGETAAFGVDAFKGAGILHPGKHFGPRQFPVGEDTVGNQQEPVRRRPRGQFARKDQQVGGGAAGRVRPKTSLVLDKGKPRGAIRPLVGGGQLHNCFPNRFLLVFERNAQAFRVMRHSLPMPVKGKRNSLIDAQSGEDAPAHQQAHLPGRKARLCEGNNPVVMINEGIHF